MVKSFLYLLFSKGWLNGEALSSWNRSATQTQRWSGHASFLFLSVVLNRAAGKKTDHPDWMADLSKLPVCQHVGISTLTGESIWHAASMFLSFLTSCWTMATLGKASAFATTSDVNNQGMPPWIVPLFCQGLDCHFERDGHMFLVWTEARKFQSIIALVSQQGEGENRTRWVVKETILVPPSFWHEDCYGLPASRVLVTLCCAKIQGAAMQKMAHNGMDVLLGGWRFDILFGGGG